MVWYLEKQQLQVAHSWELSERCICGEDYE